MAPGIRGLHLQGVADRKSSRTRAQGLLGLTEEADKGKPAATAAGAGASPAQAGGGPAAQPPSGPPSAEAAALAGGRGALEQTCAGPEGGRRGSVEAAVLVDALPLRGRHAVHEHVVLAQVGGPLGLLVEARVVHEGDLRRASAHSHTHTHTHTGRRAARPARGSPGGS